MSLYDFISENGLCYTLERIEASLFRIISDNRKDTILKDYWEKQLEIISGARKKAEEERYRLINFK